MVNCCENRIWEYEAISTNLSSYKPNLIVFLISYWLTFLIDSIYFPHFKNLSTHKLWQILKCELYVHIIYVDYEILIRYRGLLVSLSYYII